MRPLRAFHSVAVFLNGEAGLATLIALIALSLFSALGLFVSLDAVTEVRLSDNHEAHVRASVAARAGLNHARELLRGLEFDDLLRGPDGRWDGSAAYLSEAMTYQYRNPLPWLSAAFLDVENPSSSVTGMPDDGLLNTGSYGTAPGTVLVPLTGIALTATNGFNSGTTTAARYFVKVSDNSHDPSESAGDPASNPFFDADGVIIIRSMGVARTVREALGTEARENAVSVFEARFKRTWALDVGAPLAILGSEVAPSGSEMFSGSAFRIDGGENTGVATIDTIVSDMHSPAALISSALGPDRYDLVEGAGLRPSIRDITSSIRAGDPDRAALLNPSFWWDLVGRILPGASDRFYPGGQTWAVGDMPDLGFYDGSRENNDPVQNPRITVVQGDLGINGSISGAGVLLVRGRLWGSGSLRYAGLILVLGMGDADLSALDLSLEGGMIIASLDDAGGSARFGATRLSLGGASTLVSERDALRMAIRLIPAMQFGWREIVTTSDP